MLLKSKYTLFLLKIFEKVYDAIEISNGKLYLSYHFFSYNYKFVTDDFGSYLRFLLQYTINKTNKNMLFIIDPVILWWINHNFQLALRLLGNHHLLLFFKFSIGLNLIP